MQTKTDIFPATGGGPTAMASRYGVPFLGKIPLDPAMLACCEAGVSFTDTQPDSPAAAPFAAVVEGPSFALSPSLPPSFAPCLRSLPIGAHFRRSLPPHCSVLYSLPFCFSLNVLDPPLYLFVDVTSPTRACWYYSYVCALVLMHCSFN